MNYFAHARRFLDRPYFIAGTALPDWLNVVNRRVRCRTRQARPFCNDSDNSIAEFAQGIVQHHADDAKFHGTREFTELSLRLAGEIRDGLGDDSALRPGFVGHVLVELLLDAELITADPPALEKYYGQLQQTCPKFIASAVELMTGQRADTLEDWINRFLEIRFLFDYTDDAKLLFRLNQVLRRVGLPVLADDFLELLPEARRRVGQNAEALLATTHGKWRITPCNTA